MFEGALAQTGQRGYEVLLASRFGFEERRERLLAPKENIASVNAIVSVWLSNGYPHLCRLNLSREGAASARTRAARRAERKR